MYSLIDARWNPAVPTDLPNGRESALWLFSIELLQRSLKENLPMPSLLHRITTYYALLTQEQITLDPIVPLIIVSHDLGLCDTSLLAQLQNNALRDTIAAMGLKIPASNREATMNTRDLFNIELERFQSHFSIATVEALYLLDD